MRDLRWQDLAACRGRTDVNWFPTVSNTQRADIDAARAVCASCHVRRACLAYALSFTELELHGVWAGTTQSQRRKLLRKAHQWQ